MIAGPRDWKGKSQRAFAALLLSVLSGVATATYAGYALTSAWTIYVDCNPPPTGTSCTYRAFWGLSPTWFLVACLLGIAVGLLIAVVGWELYRRAFGLSLGMYTLMGLSLAGLVAYGGFGIGTAAGVVGSLLFASLQTRRSGAPTEWSGSYPVGVPPVKNAPRPVTERPAVSEWDGVALAGAPAAAETPTKLPSADRLAAALRRSRQAVGSGAARPSAAPAMILLPPPPTGLGLEPPSAPVPTQAPRPSRPPFGGPGAEPLTGSPAPRAESPFGRSAERPPPPTGAPATAPAAVPAASPASAAPTHSAGVPWAGSTAAAGPDPTAPPTAARGLAALPSRPQPSRAENSPARASPTTTVGTPQPAPALPAVPQRPLGSPHPPLPPQAPALPEPAVPSLPPQDVPNPTAPTGDTTRTTPPTRTRAWTCTHCKLVNAPWSAHCTRCRSPALGT